MSIQTLLEAMEEAHACQEERRERWEADRRFWGDLAQRPRCPIGGQKHVVVHVSDPDTSVAESVTYGSNLCLDCSLEAQMPWIFLAF